MVPNLPRRSSRRASRDVSRRSFGGGLERLEKRSLFAAYIGGNPQAYATIQAAVDAAAPNATINVDAGAYPEQVYVGKPLTIRGARAGVDARSNVRLSGAAGPETIVNGTLNAAGHRTSAFYIAASDVTIDGFVIEGQTTQGDAGAGVVIAPNRAGTQFLNNIVQNNVSGLFISNNSDTKPLVVRHNVFRHNNRDGANGGRGIYTNGAIFGDRLTNVLIDHNAFQSNYGGASTTRLEAAVAIQALGAGKQSNVTITNNVMDDNGKAVLFFNTTGIVIRNNFITNTRDHYSGTLRFEGNNHNATIQNNTVYNNTAPAVAVDSKGVPGKSSGFVVTHNNFYGNSTQYGSKVSVVFNNQDYVGAPDVRYNYWGHASGPGGDGGGSGDGVYSIGHVVPGQQWYFATGGNALWSPFSATPLGSMSNPYWGAAARGGAIIQAEDFNHGGNGVGYHDTTAGNTGGAYRPRERADLINTTDAGGGRHVQNIVAGEWLAYSVDLSAGGVYAIDLRVANAQTTGGKFHIEIDGVDVTGPLTMTSTGGDATWRTMTTTAGISLAGGQHLLKIVFDANGSGGRIGNLNWIKLTNTAPVAVPAAPSNLQAVASGPAAINLTWNDLASDETGYAIERRTGSGAWQQITTLATGSVAYTDSGVVFATTYGYRVRALGAAGDSGYSNIATTTTPAAQSVTYLSDLPFAGAPINGWGPIERDMAVGGSNAGDGGAITLNGVSYARGLGVHALSDVTFNLGGGYASFLADVGLDDKQLYAGSVVFKVYADGALVFDSGVMGAATATKSLNLDVAGVQQLRLRVEDAGDGSAHDHADWANARLTPATSQPAPAPTAPATPTGLAASAASSSQINLTWTDAANNETGFVIDRSLDGVNGWTPIATPAANATSFSDAALTAGTRYYYRVRAMNGTLASANSAVASATTATPPAPTPSLPAGWTGADIGAAATAGTSSFASGKYTLSGAGIGIGGTSDSFHFASQSLGGSGSIVAKVTPGAGGVSGIMLRESNAANAKHVALIVNPDGSVSFSRRTSTGGTTATTTAAAAAGPQYLRLTRSGGRVYAYRSLDGTTWTAIGSVGINFKTTVLAGLAVSSKSAASLYTATIENVAVTKA